MREPSTASGTMIHVGTALEERLCGWGSDDPGPKQERRASLGRLPPVGGKRERRERPELARPEKVRGGRLEVRCALRKPPAAWRRSSALVERALHRMDLCVVARRDTDGNDEAERRDRGARTARRTAAAGGVGARWRCAGARAHARQPQAVWPPCRCPVARSLIQAAREWAARGAGPERDPPDTLRKNNPPAAEGGQGRERKGPKTRGPAPGRSNGGPAPVPWASTRGAPSARRLSARRRRRSRLRGAWRRLRRRCARRL